MRSSRPGPATSSARRGPAIFLSAGETSGDEHAAAVARALLARRPDVRLLGLGGAAMAEAGVELLATLDDLAVMGLPEVVRKLPFFARLRRKVERRLVEDDVALLIPVDYPDFNMRLARFARRRRIPVLYFIAPQVWAWREGRTRQLAAYCDRVLTVLPFEAEFLRRHGVSAEFVGHPLLDRPVDPGGDVERPGDACVGIFPGSRAQEVAHMLPVFAEAAERLRARRPGLDFLVARPPHLAPELYARYHLPLAPPAEVRRRAFAAMTKSGTITLELALAGIPMVVAYRTGPITFALARRLVRVPFIALVNLVAEERLVPELIQTDATAERVAAALHPLLDLQAPERAAMTRGFARVRERLGTPGCADRVARRALELVG